jgi:disulfide bond formation protein DsbB
VSTPAVAATLALDPQAVARGKKAYISCMACHGKDGTGVKNMGKDLVHSTFVASLNDAALVDFIKKGRGPTDPANTTKIAMPPKGGNPALKDAQIEDIVAYIRSLNPATKIAAPAAAAPTPAATPAPSLPLVEPAKPTVPVAVAVAPAVSPAAVTPAPTPVKAALVPTGDAIARGKKAYMSCMACHGKDATGVKNMGKDLVNSPFVERLSDPALVDFIKKGRGPTDPDNTTRIAMPPKGGNPALKDEQIKDIVAYLRSLRQSARTE